MLVLKCAPRARSQPMHAAQVFVNTKSGPQAGAQLRRRFLRLLNPLQARPAQPCTPERMHCGLPQAPCPRRLLLHCAADPGWPAAVSIHCITAGSGAAAVRPPCSGARSHAHQSARAPLPRHRGAQLRDSYKRRRLGLG